MITENTLPRTDDRPTAYSPYRLLGRAPRFPREIEVGIDQYLAMQAPPAVNPTPPHWGPSLVGLRNTSRAMTLHF